MKFTQAKRTPSTALIFDSGVGGLTIYQAIRDQRPDIHIVYVFDNAYFPYSEKSAEVVTERAVKIVQETHKKHHLDLIIVACNTASTVALPTLRSQFSIPIVGVVPAIKPAVQLTRNGVIGLLATRATVQSEYIQNLIAQFASQYDVKLLGSTELVEIAETKLRGQPVDQQKLEMILEPWIKLAIPPDTLVLGCTHFPLLHDELLAVMPSGTRLVDSGEAIARRVASLIPIPSLKNNEIGSVPANLIYCTQWTKEVEKLHPVLLRYNFSHLEELPNNSP